MPRMGAFWRAHPEIDVHHLMSDKAEDFRTAGIDLRIRYGAGDWPDETVTQLFRERIFPVCGPGFAAQHAGKSEAEIGSLPLLHVEGADPDWTSWDEFMRRAGVSPGPLGGRQFNNFSVLLQATQDDQGLSLGWERLIRPLLETGKLVRFGSLQIDAPGAYYLTWNARHRLSEAASLLKDWLVETARQEPDAGEA